MLKGAQFGCLTGMCPSRGVWVTSSWEETAEQAQDILERLCLSATTGNAFVSSLEELEELVGKWEVWASAVGEWIDEWIDLPFFTVSVMK